MSTSAIDPSSRGRGRWLSPVVIGAALAATAAAFLWQQPSFRAPFFLNVGYGARALLFGALCWASYFVGRFVTRALFKPTFDFWEIELALGFFVFGAVSFALAAAHFLYPWLIRVVVVAVIAASAPTLWRLVRGAADYLKLRWAAVTPGTRFLAAGLLPYAVVLLLASGEPQYEWDVLVYHLYLPKLFVAAHSVVYEPRLAFSSMPLGAEMNYAWAYGWGGLGAAAAVAEVFHVLAVVATWRLARLYLDNFWATAAAAVLLFTPAFGFLFHTAYVDFILAAWALMALTVYLRGFARGGEAALAGLLLGAALGVKYTAVHAVVAFLAVAAADLARRRLSFRHALVFGGVAVTAFAPWMVKAFVERGNPVFPVLYGVFGGRDMPPEVAAGVVRALRGIGFGRGWEDYLLLPYRVSFAGSFYTFGHLSGWIWPFTLCAVPLAAIWFRRGRLLLFTLAYFVSWAFIGSQQLRFLSAFFGAAAVIVAGVCAAAAAPFRGGARSAVRFILVAGLVASGYFLNFDLLTATVERFRDFQTGGRDAFLSKWASCYDADKFINRDLPREAKILLVFDNCRLYLERPAVCDSFCDASETLYAVGKMKSADDIAAYLAALGITHIRTNLYIASYFWRFYDRETRSLWTAFIDKYTTVIYRRGHYEIRALSPPPGP